MRCGVLVRDILLNVLNKFIVTSLNHKHLIKIKKTEFESVLN